MSRLLTVLVLTATAAAELPLPDGAIARLGSARSRAASTGMTVAFSPDGRRVAFVESQSVAVFTVATGRLERLLPLPDKHYTMIVRFLADGKRLAAGSREGQTAGQVTV